jgi:hypothetical protein
VNPLLTTRRDWIKVALSTAAGIALAPSTILAEKPSARSGGGLPEENARVQQALRSII